MLCCPQSYQGHKVIAKEAQVRGRKQQKQYTDKAYLKTRFNKLVPASVLLGKSRWPRDSWLNSAAIAPLHGAKGASRRKMFFFECPYKCLRRQLAQVAHAQAKYVQEPQKGDGAFLQEADHCPGDGRHGPLVRPCT